jgi:methionine salvage enolase-phosphatase E1
MQVEEDLRNGVVGAVPVAPSDAGKEEVINSLVTNVESMIKADRKITSLKQLQVPFTFLLRAGTISFSLMEFCSNG